MNEKDPKAHWHSRILQPRVPWYRHPLRPADVSEGLCTAMLANESAIEDVNYSKVVPNRFIVEVNQQAYARNFHPIEERVVQQWSDRLLTCLVTTNSRQGRRAYRLGGPVQIEIRPSPDLSPFQARILTRIQPEGSPPDPGPVTSLAIDTSAKRPAGLDTGDAGATPAARDRAAMPTTPQVDQACLQSYPTGPRWPLKDTTTTLGRDDTNDIVFNRPEIIERRLVSGQHAYIRAEQGRYWIFDGSPGGRASVNGTYVNGQRVGPGGGLPLKDGDLIVLAAIDPGNPSPDTPGVAALRFSRSCS